MRPRAAASAMYAAWAWASARVWAICWARVAICCWCCAWRVRRLAWALMSWARASASWWASRAAGSCWLVGGRARRPRWWFLASRVSMMSVALHSGLMGRAPRASQSLPMWPVASQGSRAASLAARRWSQVGRMVRFVAAFARVSARLVPTDLREV